MRALALGLLLAAMPAHADLYRWIDPQTGSVKFSSVPPPWHGDAAKEARSPKVEVISSQPAAKPGAEKPAAPRPLASLEDRWRAMLQVFDALPSRADFNRAGQGIQQQVQAYEAMRAELDRQDPSGAARRRAEEAGILERLKKGLEAQSGR